MVRVTALPEADLTPLLDAGFRERPEEGNRAETIDGVAYPKRVIAPPIGGPTGQRPRPGGWVRHRPVRAAVPGLPPSGPEQPGLVGAVQDPPRRDRGGHLRLRPDQSHDSAGAHDVGRALGCGHRLATLRQGHADEWARSFQPSRASMTQRGGRVATSRSAGTGHGAGISPHRGGLPLGWCTR